jgi:lysophospholipase L1-like esterase
MHLPGSSRDPRLALTGGATPVRIPLLIRQDDKNAMPSALFQGRSGSLLRRLAGPPGRLESAGALVWVVIALTAGRASEVPPPREILAPAIVLGPLWLLRFVRAHRSGALAFSLGWLIFPVVTGLAVGHYFAADVDRLKRLPGADWQHILGNTAAQPAPRTRQLQARYAEQFSRGGIDIAFLGDSLTSRWATAGRDVWEEVFAPHAAANFGVGEDRTQHLLWRVTAGGLLDGPPVQTVVLLIGTNNIARNTPDEIVEAIGQIVRAVRGRQPQARIVLLGLLPRGREANGSDRREVAAVNRRLAKSGEPDAVTYLDLGPHFLDAAGRIDPAIMPDALHLSTAGYRTLADALAPVLFIPNAPSPRSPAAGSTRSTSGTPRRSGPG